MVLDQETRNRAYGLGLVSDIFNKLNEEIVSYSEIMNIPCSKLRDPTHESDKSDNSERKQIMEEMQQGLVNKLITFDQEYKNLCQSDYDLEDNKTGFFDKMFEELKKQINDQCVGKIPDNHTIEDRHLEVLADKYNLLTKLINDTYSAFTMNLPFNWDKALQWGIERRATQRARRREEKKRRREARRLQQELEE